MLFNQLLSRGESCQNLINSLLTAEVDKLSTDGVRSKQYQMPSAEPIILQSVVKMEGDANVEELLGNLARYELYDDVLCRIKFNW